MTKVTDALARADAPVFICDFTPPRGGDTELLEGAAKLDGDFISTGYNPGKLVRVDSVAAAYAIKARFGRGVVFNLSPRDMNQIAIESRLLGAQLLGLENVLVIQGDAIAERDGVQGNRGATSTGLLAEVRGLNDGLDYRGAKLRSASDFCIGASIDVTRDTAAEAALTRRKVEAGAQYFVTQPVFAPAQVDAFLHAYEAAAGEVLSLPVFWGIQVLAPDGVLFSSVPESARRDLEAGRSGVDIALEAYEALRAEGVRSFYVVAPIMRGGARDYDAAAEFLRRARGA